MAILIEHTAGKWPFFLSPRQAVVCPISDKSNAYAESIYLYLHQMGFQVEFDTSTNTINKKKAVHLTEQWNYILVVGEKEAENGTVDITDRDDQKKRRVMKVHELGNWFKSMLPEPSNAYKKMYANAFKPPADDNSQ